MQIMRERFWILLGSDIQRVSGGGVDFIINYDIKHRLGRDTGEEEEEASSQFSD